MSEDRPRPRLGHKLHDSFFRVIFGEHRAAAIGALRSVLPPRLAAALDFDRLAPLAGDFVTPALRQRRVDLIFDVPLGEHPARVVLLYEQQLKALRLMVWRGSDYVSAIWRDAVARHRAEHGRPPKTLPAVIPVVLYTGRARWRQPTSLTELIDLPGPLLEEARPYLPELRLHVDALHGTSDAALRARGAGPMALLGWFLLKHAPGAVDLVERMRGWVGDLAAVDALPGGRDAVAAMAEYCVQVSRTPREAIADVFGEALGPEGEELVMTTGQLLKAEGRAEGRAEGKAELLIGLIEARFGGLSAPLRARIERETSDLAFARWSRRIFDVTRPEELIDDA